MKFNIKHMLNVAEKFTVDNSPQILTVLGAVGAVTTAVLTAKATFKAAHKLSEQSPHLETKEKVQLVWTYYLPPVGTGVLTVAVIVGANRVSSRRAAAMALAYSVSERAFDEYKEKVVEKLGKNKERAARDEIAQQHVDRNPVGRNEVIITGGGEVLCFDKYTGRYFMSSMEALKKAENDVNFYILNNDYANLNDFYRLIGLPTVPVGDEVGWTPEFNFEILFSTTISENGKPCIVTDYQVAAIRRRPSSPGLKAVNRE